MEDQAQHQDGRIILTFAFLLATLATGFAFAMRQAELHAILNL